MVYRLFHVLIMLVLAIFVSAKPADLSKRLLVSAAPVADRNLRQAAVRGIYNFYADAGSVFQIPILQPRRL
jgi:hypothetical protein